LHINLQIQKAFDNIVSMIVFTFVLIKVWRYQRGNQKP